MARISKAQRETDLFREKIKALLAEPQGWRNYEDQRYWLEKLLRRDEDHAFTVAERDAVDRVIYARVLFEGWAGYSVAELLKAALRYVADFDDNGQDFLRTLEAERPTKLNRDDMRYLVSLCFTAGLDIQGFPSRPRTAEAA